MTGVRVGALLTPHCLPDVGAPLLLVLGAAPPLPDPWLWPRLEYQIGARPGFRFRPAWQGRDTLGQSRRLRWQHSSQGPGCRPTGLTGVPGPSAPVSALGPGRASPGCVGGGLHSSRATVFSGSWWPATLELLGCVLCAQTCAPPAISPAKAVPAPRSRRGGCWWGAVGLCSPGIQAPLGRCGHWLVCRGQTS